MSTTTNVSTLKINYLTQSQYDTALNNNQINENEIYLTPTEDMTLQEVDDFVSELNIGGNAGTAVDLVVEQGISGMWTYRKWSSGIAECWAITPAVSHAMTTQSGNGYYCAKTYQFPSGLFTSVNNVQANRDAGQGLVFISIYGITTTGLSCYISCTTTLTQTFGISFYATGRWK